MTQYATLREKIAAETAERNSRYEQFAELFAKAYEEGLKAGQEAIPAPMVVTQHANQMDDSSPVEKSWYVSEGVCGFAWVLVRPGNSSFAHWLRKTGKGSKAYYGGMQVWISAHGQSYERKMAHARRMADVLKEGLAAMGYGNVSVYGQGRLD